MSKFNVKWGDAFLTHESPELFYGPQCRLPLIVFVVWRLVVSAYVLSIITFNQAYKFDRYPNPFVYFTNWNMMFQALALCFKAIVTVYVSTREKCRRADEISNNEVYWKMAWYMKIEWVFHNISSVIPITVLTYWATFENEKALKWNQRFFYFFTVQTHGLTAIIATLDVLFCAIPIRLLHFYQPLMFHVIYYIFSAIYQSASGGHTVYENDNFNWNYPNGVLLRLVNQLALAAVIHIGIWFLKTMQTKLCCNPLNDPKEKQFFHEKTPLLRHDLYKSTDEG